MGRRRGRPLHQNWYANPSHSTLLGFTANWSFPGNENGLVRYITGVAHPGTVGSRDITTARNPTIR